MKISNSKVVKKLLGDSKHLDLDKRIYIYTTLFAFFVSFTGIIRMFFLDFPVSLIICFVLSFITYSLLYYFSRFKQVFSIKLVISATLLLLIGIWVCNNGIRGPSPLLFIIALLIFLGISNSKYHLRILLLTVFVLVLLIVIENIFGNSIINYYQDELSLTKDLIFGYPVFIILSFLIFNYLKKSYEAENNNLSKSQIELKKINESKNLLFSIIAHDLKSPFNGLLGLTEIMAKNSNELKIEDYKKYSRLNLKSMKNVYNLLESLLNWGRIQQGKINITPQKLNLYELTHECTLLFKNICSKKELIINIDINKSLEILSDKCTIETIVRNLFSNALKFTPHKGSITISAIETENNIVLFKIIDTGIGMNNDMLRDLFKVDVKSNRKGLDGELSTGLGLIICRELCDHLGGTFNVESEVNVGTCFSFTVKNMQKKE